MTMKLRWDLLSGSSCAKNSVGAMRATAPTRTEHQLEIVPETVGNLGIMGRNTAPVIPERQPTEAEGSDGNTAFPTIPNLPGNIEISADKLQAWEERAAIMEFDGGLTRENAERMAWKVTSSALCDV